MTQETLGYVELEWTCQRCGTRNPGSQKICSGCGGAMSDQDQFELPAQQELITDAEQIKQAERGADVHCAFCGTRNPAGAQTCSQCGADLKEAQAREVGRVLGAHRTGPAADVPCPFCGEPNPPNAPRCVKCGGSLKQQKPVAPPPTPRAQKPQAGGAGRGILVGIVAGACLIVLCIAAAIFGLLMSHTTDTDGVVRSVAWERTIEIMEQRPVTHEDWQDKIPAGAQRGSCTRKVRSTQSQPAPGAEKVCGTPYVIDQGSGKGKVVQDCEYKVYDQWCKYTVNEWTVVDAAKAQGADLQPQWPDLRLRSDQREGKRGEKYTVTFQANDKSYTYSPSAADFPQFAVGSQWTLKVNALGGVNSVQPK
jgi:ribosomal protein L40E